MAISTSIYYVAQEWTNLEQVDDLFDVGNVRVWAVENVNAYTG